MSAEHPILEQARALRTQLDGLRALSSELIRQLAALDLPDPLEATCPLCGVHTKGPRSLEEHVYVSHAGPLPSSYARADELAEDRADSRG